MIEMLNCLTQEETLNIAIWFTAVDFFVKLSKILFGGGWEIFLLNQRGAQQSDLVHCQDHQA